MPILLWLGGIVATIFGQFATSMSKRAVFATAALAVSAALLLALANGIKALLVGISYSFPAWAATGAMFLPSNLSICISAIVTAKLARVAYDYGMANLKIVSSIN